MARNTIQTGIKGMTRTSFADYGGFLNGIDVTHKNLGQFTPYIKGVSRVFLHKPAQFMNNLWKDKTRGFKTYLESNFTAIDGINDVSVEFTEFEGGFAGQRFSNVQLARDDSENLTISLYELSGSPIREYLDLWVTGTRDIRSGVAHYHGALTAADTEKTAYGEINHTAEFIYANLDPTAIEIEYAAMWAHAFPTKVPKSHLNFEKGNRDNALIDMEFRATKYESPAINDVAKWYITKSAISYNYLDFDPQTIDKATDGTFTRWDKGGYGSTDGAQVNGTTMDDGSSAAGAKIGSYKYGQSAKFQGFVGETDGEHDESTGGAAATPAT